jgi:hypothetical protein
MMNRTLLIFLLTIIVSGVLFAQKPNRTTRDASTLFHGSWKANLEKSQRDPNHQFSSLTAKFEFIDEAVVLTYSGINMGGRQEGSVRNLYPDGKERPVTAAPGFSETTRWRSKWVLESNATKDGRTVGQSTYEISRDKKTLTAKVKGVDARGRPFEQVIVFERDLGK